MNKQLDQVKEFHKKFRDVDAAYPTIDISHKEKMARIHVMKEELQEVVEAIDEEQDIADLAKELADLVYTTLGTINAFGLRDKFEEIFDEVHRSNMSKDFIPGDIKPIKGKNYKAADIKNILS